MQRWRALLLSALLLLLCAVCASAAADSKLNNSSVSDGRQQARFLVSCGRNCRAAGGVRRRLAALGCDVVTATARGDDDDQHESVLVVTAPLASTPPGGRRRLMQQQEQQLRQALPAAAVVERDAPRAPIGPLPPPHSKLLALPKARPAADPWALPWAPNVAGGACAARNARLGPGPQAETLPYGVAMVQGSGASSSSSSPPNSTLGAGVIICEIDSGVWTKHPDLSRGANNNANSNKNAFAGCEALDADDPGGCPFPWDADAVGHGTHVAGVAAAPRNGVGVVGVLPGGAELYSVRIYETRADVAEGEGPFASDLVVAYTACEGRLRSRQAAQPGRRYRMVVNMSFGSSGPLTTEEMWIERAASRGDVLFVAAAGNNGGGDAPAAPTYPASYPQVISIGAVDCFGELLPLSSTASGVDLVAPGVRVLSTVPAARGYMRATLALAMAPRSALPPRNSAGRVLDLMQPEPRPMRGAPLGAAVGLGLAECGGGGKSGDAGCARARGAACLAALSPTGEGGLDAAACTALERCARAGGAALVAWRDASPADVAALSGAADAGAAWVDGATVDCGAPRCAACLQRLRSGSGKLPLAVTVAPHQGATLLALARKGGANSSAATPKLSVDTFSWPYQFLDGTSMAAPHVAAGAARVWAAHPRCRAADVRAALEATAKDLGPRGRDASYGAGLLQIEAAAAWLARRPCAQKESPRA